MSGVPKRSHEEGVTHPSSSSSAAKYPHEDSGSYPKSPHQPVTPPPAQVHHHHQQQPHQHPQSQSQPQPQPQPQPHLHTLPHPHSHSHSHSPLAAAAAAPYEVESRTVVKVARSEPRDGERRSPLPLVYRSPSLPATVSSSDPHLTHAPVPMETRDGTKDGREIRVENRENRSDGREIQGPKSDRDVKFDRSVDDFTGKGNTGSYIRNDGREMYGETKRETQGPKSDRDAKFERPGDDFSGKSNAGSYTRDTKFDRENQNYNEQKAEIKMEKDGHAHLAWKEQKDYHRGKRVAEGSTANVDPWVASRGNPQGPTEVGPKDFSAPVEGPHLEGRETVGENKVDAKNEDRFKDKDKKRKELKHREWGDRDKDRNDRRVSVLVGSVMSEPKEIGREDRESDRWERERMEQKDRERNKEKDKDHIKREPRTGAEKEISQNEKELGEASAKPSEQEFVAPEQKKQNEPDNWEKDERESKEKRRERDGDSEAERAEKRSRISEKESEDGCLEGEGATEREKDAFNYGVQQRKRALRPRGSPQTTNREHVHSRSQDNEGVQGKSEVSIVVYKVGECMQELIKLWKEYDLSHPDKSGDFANNGPTLEVRIPAEHVTATNRQVRGGQLWGTDIYTDDSDLVAVLMHTGYCRPTASPPPPTMQELRTTIRVLPSQDYYTSKLRNNVRSRAWGAGIGCSYRVERCYILKKGGGTIELEPSLTHSSTVEPTLAPMAVERSMTTRAAASNALRQQRFVREVTIQYNLCNEPWIKYSISIVADKGLKKPLFTSARLKKGEVLYLETHSCRYELCFAGEKTIKAIQASQQQSSHEAMETDNNNNKSQNHLTNGDKTDSDNSLIDVFRWSRCKKPLPQKLMRSIGVPLPADHIEVLEENLDWEDVQWSQTGVWIAGKEYTLARVHFLSPN
ncbi:Histone deacetylation protein Rxt3 [Arabidopsis thaliana x Arabidopsis arenosa]|uniref:Histone deacetylation protein Rxt3 n=1 Tax=Arabidopsis thaliana x Arabidopsis arenosa TaxID=1240361 RepID=A0A8T1YV31_9BRAS|nr:Histone deacetylation protein Rxt3 [Arabidopsis thaliana x Arabidopsis arenosa]